MYCPRCSYPLEMLKGRVELDHCYRCSGNFFETADMAEVFGKRTEPDNWVESHAATDQGLSKLKCPKNHGPLHAYRVAFGDKEVEVDACSKCKGLWLDGQEGEQLRSILTDVYKDRQKAEDSAGGVVTYLFQLFTGFPIEVYNPVKKRPVLLYATILALVLIFVGQMVLGEGFSMALALIPQKLFAGQQVWGLFTYGLLHGGLFHLLSNLYFFYVFGDNVEDTLGKLGLALICLAGSVGGGIAESIGGSDHAVPVVGFSAAISGIMAAYLVLFPKVRLWVVVFFVRFRIRVVWYLLFWIGIQFVSIYLNQPGVAWYAHIGGFIAGGATAFAIRNSCRVKRPFAQKPSHL